MTKSRGIRPPRIVWSLEMDTLLAQKYPDEKAANIAALLGVNVHNVYSRAYGLGLKKSEDFFANPALSGRTDGTRGSVTQFKRGAVSWNKGMNVSTGGAATRFKEGSLPHNTKDVGAFRITASGLLQKKINEAKGNNSKRWRSVHELIWIEKYGPVPDGSIIVFKPGMRTTVLEDITVEKIECVTKAENMRRNTRHNLPPQLNEVIQLQSLLTRHINKRSKSDERE